MKYCGSNCELPPEKGRLLRKWPPQGEFKYRAILRAPMRPPLGPTGVKASEGLVNIGQSLLSSCSPSDAVLLRDMTASSTAAAARAGAQRQRSLQTLAYLQTQTSHSVL